MKKGLIVVLVVVFILSAFSMFSVIRNLNNDSLKTYALERECSAQSDYQPQSLDGELLAPLEKPETDIFGSAQGDVCPPAWPDPEPFDPDPWWYIL